MGSTFIFIGLLIFSAHLFAALFSKRRIPDVLLLMAIGIVIGPVLHWVTPESLSNIGAIFSSLTLLLILESTPASMPFAATGLGWSR